MQAPSYRQFSPTYVFTVRPPGGVATFASLRKA